MLREDVGTGYFSRVYERRNLGAPQSPFISTNSCKCSLFHHFTVLKDSRVLSSFSLRTNRVRVSSFPRFCPGEGSSKTVSLKTYLLHRNNVSESSTMADRTVVWLTPGRLGREESILSHPLRTNSGRPNERNQYGSEDRGPRSGPRRFVLSFHKRLDP